MRRKKPLSKAPRAVARRGARKRAKTVYHDPFKGKAYTVGRGGRRIYRKAR